MLNNEGEKNRERGMTLQAIEQLADRLIEEAYMLQASDIHIVPRKQDALVQFRLGGMLVTKNVLSKQTCERLLAHFKFLADMDIGERRRPQSGAMEMNLTHTTIHLRLSTLPTIYDEA
ncbi:putative type II secretion system protein E [Anoxybacillus sp. BCO1]|nr:putative type II secretion system protein E [Anoxybacillus sp. BCO1]